MTSMVDIEEFLPDVLAYAPSCPVPLAYRWIRDAAKQICVRGMMWREWDQFQVTSPESEGVCTYPDASIERIESAKLDNIELTAVTPGWLDSNVRDWESYSDNGQGKWVTQISPNTVTVVPKVTGMLKLRLVLVPSRTAEMLPAFLLDQHATEISKGAAGRVLTTPNKEFANPQLGLAMIGEFTAALDTIAVKAAKGQQTARLHTKGRYF